MADFSSALTVVLQQGHFPHTSTLKFHTLGAYRACLGRVQLVKIVSAERANQLLVHYRQIDMKSSCVAHQRLASLTISTIVLSV